MYLSVIISDEQSDKFYYRLSGHNRRPTIDYRNYRSTKNQLEFIMYFDLMIVNVIRIYEAFLINYLYLMIKGQCQCWFQTYMSDFPASCIILKDISV